MFQRIASQYSGKTVVIIGAGGIGSAIVELLTEQAVKVVIADHSRTALDRATARLPKESHVKMAELDVTNAQAVDQFFSKVINQLSSIDYLFYTAGILNIESLAETHNLIWDRAVSINLSGAFYCMNTAARYMREARAGSILILGSIAGTKARSGSRVSPVYNATKAGVVAMVNGAAMQLRSYGVRVNCISPGPTATAMMDVQPIQVHESVNQIALDGRMNSAMEVAELALFVAAHGRFTGEDVPMGGGAGLGG